MRPIPYADQRSRTLHFLEEMSSCKTTSDADGTIGQLAARCWHENSSQCTCMMMSGCDWLICLKFISTGKLKNKRENLETLEWTHSLNTKTLL